MSLPACMGGWCAKRELCGDYNAKRKRVVERLCPKGQDDPTPVAFTRTVVPTDPRWWQSERVGAPA